MKKFISIFTMLAFIVFSLSCTITKNMRLDAANVRESGRIKILQVVKKSGEIVEFSKKQPGRVLNKSIIGIAERVTQEIEIDITDVEHNKCNENGEVYEIMTIDGKVYKDFVGEVKKEKERYIFTTILKSHIEVSIPISEVKQVSFEGKKLNIPILVVLGIIVVVIIIILVAKSNQEESTWDIFEDT